MLLERPPPSATFTRPLSPPRAIPQPRPAPLGAPTGLGVERPRLCARDLGGRVGQGGRPDIQGRIDYEQSTITRRFHRSRTPRQKGLLATNWERLDQRGRELQRRNGRLPSQRTPGYSRSPSARRRKRSVGTSQEPGLCAPAFARSTRFKGKPARRRPGGFQTWRG